MQARKKSTRVSEWAIIDFIPIIVLNKIMALEIVFIPSAFKHTISEENIRWVLLNHLADGIIEEDDETKYLSVGWIMANMTDEEYDALDERWTKTTPKVNFSRPGVFARQRALLEVLDKVTASYIMTQAEATGQTPAQVTNKIIHQQITAEI
jgi:hypothetical protein